METRSTKAKQTLVLCHNVEAHTGNPRHWSPFRGACQRAEGRALQGLELSLGPAPRENVAIGWEGSQTQTKLWLSGISHSCHFSL